MLAYIIEAGLGAEECLRGVSSILFIINVEYIGTPKSWDSHIFATVSVGFDLSADLGVAKKTANFQPLRPRDTVEADSADGSARVGMRLR